MIPCPFCKQEIENDSLYCDQCGEKLKVCPECGTFGKKNFCTNCRTKLVYVADQAGHNEPAQPAPSPAATPPANKENSSHTPAPTSNTDNQEQHTVRAADNVASPQPTIQQPKLHFSNQGIGADFYLNSGDILGRRNGPYTHLFSKFNQVSGTHAKVDYNQMSGWSLTDLGSTNGTRYQNNYLQAQTPCKLEDNSYIKIANVELYVRIES